MIAANHGKMEHIVIRRPEYVAGSKSNPELTVFVQTNIRGPPTPRVERLMKGQMVWMKWSGGPIVGRSKILSWEQGKIKNGDIDEVKGQIEGTGLSKLDEYWGHIKKKGDSYFLILRLSDPQMLDHTIKPRARSYGSDWIYIDTEERRESWLMV